MDLKKVVQKCVEKFNKNFKLSSIYGHENKIPKNFDENYFSKLKNFKKKLKTHVDSAVPGQLFLTHKKFWKNIFQNWQNFAKIGPENFKKVHENRTVLGIKFFKQKISKN